MWLIKVQKNDLKPILVRIPILIQTSAKSQVLSAVTDLDYQTLHVHIGNTNNKIANLRFFNVNRPKLLNKRQDIYTE
jgi:hypothetical protein